MCLILSMNDVWFVKTFFCQLNSVALPNSIVLKIPKWVLIVLSSSLDKPIMIDTLFCVLSKMYSKNNYVNIII